MDHIRSHYQTVSGTGPPDQLGRIVFLNRLLGPIEKNCRKKRSS